MTPVSFPGLGEGQAKKEVRSSTDKGLVPNAASEKTVKTKAQEEVVVLWQRKGPLVGEEQCSESV